MMIKRTISLILILSLFLLSCGYEELSAPTARSEELSPGNEASINIPVEGSSEEIPSEESISPPDSGDIIIVDGEPDRISAEEPFSEEPVEEPAENTFEGYVLSEADVSENGVYLKTVSTPGEVVIDFAGDINFDDRYANMNALRSRPGGIFDSIGSSLIERTNAADIFMINNEFPYSKRGSPVPNKKYTFRAKPETVEMMKSLGADIVSLANNHAFDHGADALLDTFDTLDSAGIPYVGAGHNIGEAMKPVYFIAGGMKISFVSATQIERSLPPDTREATETDPGVLRTLEPDKFLQVIRNAKENSDFCIAYVHWGSEGTNKYESSQTELATLYEEAGADLIIGDHPHVLQGITYINDTPVFYSMGNYWFNSKPLDTCLVEAVIRDKEIASLRFIPCMQHNCATNEVPSSSGDYERILNNMRTWSTENVNIDEEGFVIRK